ncbi:hypothetical protein CROQUDRAFT_95252 [Cronartium quercuum f. sp. fusiforme G11]|uniref:Uncharacterized protein n=1 Tax=Cronartium quercuum f. sp. fusiforme G11 TaxID=708437 RepID=A0A9P6TA46_9BASI|nr:hypothetical protein CROQUDRAFT_95252 [Cronartium quercuum f. sp. fusiforme G11]
MPSRTLSFSSAFSIRPPQFESTIKISESDVSGIPLGTSPGCTQRCLLEIPTESDVPGTALSLSRWDHLGDISGKSQLRKGHPMASSQGRLYLSQK